MSFFLKKKPNSKQAKPGSKRPAPTGKSKAAPKKTKLANKTQLAFDDEEIESDSDFEDDGTAGRDKGYSSSEEEEETVQEKKLRLAKQYLAQIEVEEKEKHGDDDDDGDDLVSQRLKHDQLEQTGKLQRKVADTVEAPSAESLILFRGHQLSVTCVVISHDAQFIYSAAKDSTIIKWNVKDRRKEKIIHRGKKGDKKPTGHTSHILSLALSSDGKYLASGDADKLIHIWDAGPMTLLHTFKGHRDTVTGLTFRRDSHDLYSCSNDRSVKIWNVDEGAYVETLFGHQDKITAIDSLSRERAVTAGGRDSTVRIWKILEESQLVFNAHSLSSIDCIALINETNFISGADDNSLSLWGAMKKKPLTTVRNAHGTTAEGEEGKGVTMPGSAGEENWITAVAALHNSDVVASGSKDGCLRLWRCSADYRKLEPLFSIPITGFVNSLKFSSNGQYLVAGVGQEHRLGRWWSNKQAKNSVVVIPLNINLNK